MNSLQLIMKVADIPFQDSQFSSHYQSDVIESRSCILQLIKRANKTLVSIQSYLENTDCDQLEDHTPKKYASEQEMDKYNHSEDYYKLYFHMYKVNESIMSHLENLAKKVGKFKDEVNEIDKQHKGYLDKIKITTKKKHRRISADIPKDHECPYDNCYRSYGSDVSLNLHIKIKHGGGNKSERQKLAQKICLAEQTGGQMPIISVNLPPGFLNSYRKRFRMGSRDTTS